jgi:hypothetical protein
MIKHPNPSCVVKVGYGRGFIFEHHTRVAKKILTRRLAKTLGNRPFIVKERLVLTAAHCLPKLPPAHAFSVFQDRTYSHLLSSLDGAKSNV